MARTMRRPEWNSYLPEKWAHSHGRASSAENTALSARRRLAWQCRRGMRELDEFLGGYLQSRDEQLDVPEMESLENANQFNN